MAVTILRTVRPSSQWQDTLIRLEGKATRQIVLAESDLRKVRTVADVSAEVPKGAFSQKE